jgi:hypothetical protein
MARQMRIPGTEGDIDEKCAELGASFAKEGAKAKKQNDKKKAAGDALIEYMRLKKIPIYRDLEADPPIEIILGDPKYSVRVKTIAKPDDEAEDKATQPKADA